MSELRVRQRTPPGRGGVSVLSVEGPGALERVRALAPGVRGDRGDPQLARLSDGGEGVEEALVLVAGPERVELHLHGSPPLVRRALELLGGGSGAPPRTIEERARELLARAPGEAGARILLDQAEGALRRELAALSAAPDPELERGLAELLEAARISERALQPARVVLAGPANAGKSTLFNVLYGGRRTVTSGERGTTRDAVVERARLGAWPVELVDTAGERDVPEGAARGVELAGQRTGLEARSRADLVFWLLPSDAPGGGPRPAPELAAEVPHVVLRSCADRGGSGADGPRSLSALEDPGGAARVVERAFREILDLPVDPWVPGRAVPFAPELTRALGSLAALPPAGGRAGLAILLAR